MSKIDTIIFDLGGVLIDWKSEYVFLDVFNGDRNKMEWFLDNICTSDWNKNQDAGYPLAKATQERIALFPEWENEIKLFYGRWEDMLGDAISETVDILKKLIDTKQYKVVALTNWSAETFPIALKKFDFLHWFEGILVSGEEKTRKPFDAIYHLTLNRFDIKAENAIFIDDSLINVEAAKNLSINGIHYKSPNQLIQQLKEFNIKI